MTKKTSRHPVKPHGAARRAPTALEAIFNRGLALHQQGRMTEAKVCYQDVLAAKPAHFDSLHLLGVIALQTQQFAQAVELIGKAIAVDPRQAAAHNNLGNALDSLNQPEEAIESFNKAIALQPDYAEAYNNRGAALRKLGQAQAAIGSYDKAIELKPDYAQGWYNRGNALRSLKQSQAAVDSYRSAIRIKPDYAEAYNNCGNTLKDLNQRQAALEAFDKAIELKPAYADAHNNRGTTLGDMKDFPAAIESFDRAIALQPAYAEAHNNRGNALASQGRFHASIESFDRAIRFKATFAEPHSNRGNALRDLGHLEAAMESYEKAIALNPHYASAHWNHSLCLLLAGVFQAGWEKYEWRWESDVLAQAKRDFSQPLWLGAEPLKGKTILLHAEQGLGDTLQFCRYARLVRDLDARVIVEVQPALAGLMAGLEGVVELVARGDKLPAFDCHCPLLSLPLALGTRLETIPSPAAYLAAPGGKVDHWKQRLGIQVRPRVGLVWSGNAEHSNDGNRSLALLDLLKHLPAGLEYISLQKDVRATDLDTLTRNPHIRCFDTEIIDFTDTAALCQLVDVVISVDTSVAHLAGALGRPVWIALPFNPDWRWLLGRNDSPWYASARLYRQTASGQWDDVLATVGRDLARFLESPVKA